MASALLRCNAPFLHPQLSSNTTNLPQAQKVKIPTKSLRSSITCKLTPSSSPKRPTKTIPAEHMSKALLDYAKRTKDSEVALGVIEWISNQDWYVPLPHIYEFMIARLGQERQFDKMREALDLMATKISEPTEEAFLNMIKSYAMARMVDDAVGVLNEMEAMGIEPTTQCYNHLLCILLNDNQVKEVEELYSRMRAAGVRPDVTTFNAVIGARCRFNQIDSAMGLFEEMHELGLVANKLTYTSLLGGFMQEGRSKDAWELYEKMVSSRPAN